MNNTDKAFLTIVIIGAIGLSFFFGAEINQMNVENPGYKFDKATRAFAGANQ